MNWLMSILFLSVISILYYFSGDYILNFLGYNRNSCEKKYIAGFIFIFLLAFIIGFPMQLLKQSWNLYFYILLSVYLIWICFLVKVNFTRLKKVDFKEFNLKKFILVHVKNNWLIYLLVIMFSLLSITNQQAYYRLNYDDFYYIGKIVNQIATPHLLNENYFNGTLISINEFDLTRIMNTYELTYGFFATLFRIYIPFFCRATMVIHNYIMTFIVFKCLAKELLGEKSNSQFSVLFFSILLISAGFAGEKLGIKMYDNWQFQTAIFYGGSIVRVMSMPIIIIFSIDLIKEFNIKKFIFLALVYVTFISFSTIFIQISFLITFILLISKFIYLFINTKSKMKYTYLVLILSMSITLLLTKHLDVFNFSFIPTKELNDSMAMYSLHISNHNLIKGDIFLSHSLCIILLSFVLIKNEKFRYFLLIIVFFDLLLVSGKFNEILMLTSMNTFFVPLRTITSFTYLLIFLLGLIFIKLIETTVTRKYITISIFSLLLCISIPLYISKNLEEIKSYDKLSSGMSREGYSIQRLVNNDKMIPKPVYEIGEWFNALEYDNYRLMTPNIFPVEDSSTFAEVFLMSSNRIEMCIRDGCDDYFSSDASKLVEDFYAGKVNFKYVEPVLVQYKINYVLVFEEKLKQQIEDSEYTMVLSGKATDNQNYYLFLLD